MSNIVTIKKFGKRYDLSGSEFEGNPAGFIEAIRGKDVETTDLDAEKFRVKIESLTPRPVQEPAADQNQALKDIQKDKKDRSLNLSPLDVGSMLLMAFGGGVGGKVAQMTGRKIFGDVAPRVVPGIVDTLKNNRTLTGLCEAIGSKFLPRPEASVGEALLTQAGLALPVAGVTYAQTKNPKEALVQGTLAFASPGITKSMPGGASRWTQGLENAGINAITGGAAGLASGKGTLETSVGNVLSSAMGDLVSGTVSSFGDRSRLDTAMDESFIVKNSKEYPTTEGAFKSAGDTITEAAPIMGGSGKKLLKELSDAEVAEFERINKPLMIKRLQEIQFDNKQKPLTPAEVDEAVKKVNWRAEAERPFTIDVGGVNVPSTKVDLDVLEHRKVQEPKLREAWAFRFTPEEIEKKIKDLDWKKDYLKKVGLKRALAGEVDLETIRSISNAPLDPNAFRNRLQELGDESLELISDEKVKRSEIYKPVDEANKSFNFSSVKIKPAFETTKNVGKKVVKVQDFNPKELGGVLQSFFNTEYAGKGTYANNIFQRPRKTVKNKAGEVIKDATGKPVIKEKELTLGQLLDIRQAIADPEGKLASKVPEKTTLGIQFEKFKDKINTKVADLEASNPAVKKFIETRKIADDKWFKWKAENGRQVAAAKAGTDPNFPEKSVPEKTLKAQVEQAPSAAPMENFSAAQDARVAELAVENTSPESYLKALEKDRNKGIISQFTLDREKQKIAPFMTPEHKLLRSAYEANDFSPISMALKEGQPGAIEAVERIYKTQGGKQVATGRNILNNALVDTLNDKNNYKLIESQGSPYRVYDKEKILKTLDSILSPKDRLPPVYATDPGNPLVEMKDFFEKKKNIAEVNLGTLSTIFNNAKENQISIGAEILKGGWARNPEQAKELVNNLKMLPEGDKILQELQHTMLAGTFNNKMGRLDPEKAANFAAGKFWDAEKGKWVEGTDFSVEAAREIMSPEQLPIFDEVVKLGKIFDNIRLDPREKTRLQELSFSSRTERGLSEAGAWAWALSKAIKIVNGFVSAAALAPEKWGRWLTEGQNLPMVSKILITDVARPFALTNYQKENKK